MRRTRAPRESLVVLSTAFGVALVICGAALGGYFGAHYSLRLPQLWVRWFVIAVGAGMTAYFFVRAY